MNPLSRRTMLKAGAALGGGLLVEVSLPSAAQAAPAASKAVFTPSAYLRITPDDVITLVAGSVEMGQGTTTMHAQLVAEELEVDPSRLVVEPAGPDPRFANPLIGVQLTGGSTSTRASWEPYRRAGATAREMLVSAAAAQWKVPRSECVARDGAVEHAPTKRTVRYGALVELAAQQRIPDVSPRTKDFKVIGKPVPRVDAAPKVDGSAVFGLDVQAPGALVAVLLRSPVPGGTVKSFDATAAKALEGVTHVVQVPAGIAVVGKTYWHARRGAGAVKVEWDGGANASLDSKALEAKHLELLRGGEGTRVKSVGDVERALASGGKLVEAEYFAPFLAHATMEPQNATAHVTADKVEVWAPTQAMGLIAGTVRRFVDIAPERIVVHQTYLGGGFGRRAEQDFIAEAVQVSKAVGQPVKVVWSREDDLRHSPYRPAATHRVRGMVDSSGHVLGWHHRVATQSILEDEIETLIDARLGGAPGFVKRFATSAVKGSMVEKDQTAFEGIESLPYSVGALAVDFLRHQPGVRAAFWRSVGHSHTAFATESFIDELAHAAGKDPLELRRELLAKQHRHRWVLELAAEKAGWKTKPPEGVGRGCAVHKSFETYCAAVAEVRVEDEKVRVERLVLAIDCGRVVNPDLVKAQLESAAVFGLSAALHQRITFANGAVQQANFDGYPMVRLPECPRIEAYIRENDAAPTGVGEPGVPVIAPAVANAVFALTGKRLRRLPLSLGDA